MIKIIDLREETEHNNQLYRNIFVPMVNEILQRSLYLDRTDKSLLSNVFSKSHTFMGNLIRELLTKGNNLKDLLEKDRHIIFNYWFNIQIKSRIFILDPNQEYVAYNGQIASNSCCCEVNENFRFSHNFIRINQNLNLAKSIREIDNHGINIIYKDDCEIINIS